MVQAHSCVLKLAVKAFRVVHAGLRHSPHAHLKGENWCKNGVSVFQKGLRNVLAELLST